MAGISEEREFGIPGPEFDGDLPSGFVPIGNLSGGREPAVDNPEFADADPIEPFQSADP
jgi:hypothetical protein